MHSTQPYDPCKMSAASLGLQRANGHFGSFGRSFRKMKFAEERNIQLAT